MTLPFAPRTVDLYGESTAPFPFIAKTTQIKAPVSPIAFDYVKIITVRDGSAVVFSEFGRKSVKFGDVIVLAANVPCGSEPEDYVTATTIYVDTDYVLDQVRWQYAGLLRDRLDVQGLAEAMYSEPVQILRLGEDRVSELTSWLDELVMLSSNGDPIRHYCRMQALWFQIMHVIAPFIKVTPLRVPWFRHENKRPALPKGRSTGRLRAEVRQVAGLLRKSPSRRWTLQKLAAEVHLSPSRLSKVFVEAYGKTPLAFLTAIRVEHLARYLRETDLTVAAAMERVGWFSRSHGSRVFRQHVGVSPGDYRRLCGQIS